MTGAEIVLVVAVAENGVIGASGGLPWRLRSDLKRFRAVTMGKPLVMGRRTYESIGRALDGRDNIVVTRRRDYRAEDILVAGSLDAALALASECAAVRGVDEICVIGGGEVFSEALPLASRLYLTEVHASPDGDVFFPPVSSDIWEEVAREALPFSDGDTAEASYLVYRRRT